MINIKATADLLGLGDSLNALGISIDDPCDASALVSAIIDETTALIKETEESIALVSAKAGAQNFVATLVAILGDFAAAAVGELVDTFVADMIFGNLIGSLTSAFTLLMTAIQGIEIIILYYATLNLKTQLQNRVTMGRILVQELSFLLDFVDAINDIFGDSGADAAYAEMGAALRHVEAAEKNVGFERTRYANTKNISTANINTAISDIDKARDYLSGGVVGNIQDLLQEIHTEHGLPPVDSYNFISFGAIPNMDEFKKYFEDLKEHLRNKFTSQLEPDDPNYEADVQAKKNDLNNFIFSLVPILPKILQASLMTSVIENATNTLLEKMPIMTLVSKKNRKKLNKLLSPSNLGFDSPLPETPPAPKPLFFTDPATKDLTYRLCTTSVGIAEASILMFPSYWQFIQNAGLASSYFLTPAANSLRGVRIDMQSWVDGGTPASNKVWATQGRKISWSAQLASAKGYLQTMTGEDYFSQQQGINPQQAREETEAAYLALEDLRTAITARHANADGSFRKAPGERAFEIAQRYLIMLNAGSWFSVFKKQHVVGGIQGVRMGLNSQIAEDTELMNLCDGFIQKVESMSTFPPLKEAFDTLLASLKGTVGEGLMSDLSTGNLANLVNNLENVAVMSELANTLFCLENNALAGGLFKEGGLASGYAAFMGVDISDKTQVEKFKSWYQTKEAVVKDLQDKKTTLENAAASIDKLVTFASGLVDAADTVV